MAPRNGQNRSAGGKKETTQAVSALAAKGLRTGTLSQEEIKRVCASALSQDETRGPRKASASVSYDSLNQFLYSPAEQPDGRVRVDFRHHGTLGASDEPMHGDISGMAVQDDYLWLVSDETSSLERLSRTGDGGFDRHRSYDLTQIFDLPGDGEIDLEAIARDGDWLWLVGSHALKRKKPRPEKDDAAKTVKRLGKLERGANRYFLARVPLETQEEHGPEPVAQATDGRCAGLVRMRKGVNDLAKLLENDKHLGPSLAMPAKENGLDIEGIAVSGERVFLGLRGPVLRGMAVMLELSVKDKGDGRLRLRKAFAEEARYRLHFLELGGMAIRDMTLDGSRLLLLVGPTMELDGPVAVVSVADPFGHFDDVTFSHAVSHVLRVPHGAGTDHAEGLAQTADGRLLIAYDSPDPSRLHENGQAKDLDVFSLR